ncbi:hypothetical protein CASFOL_018064 [Castilleja foliolosa]|uniref:Uncharacterized protein n=1 Tax=Castilleja foliolosa TaxID=1961234 RepID=A0ABD3DAR7_9LAMI
MSTHDSNRSIATKIIEKVPRNFGQLKSPRKWPIEKVPIKFGQLKNNEDMMLRIAEFLKKQRKINEDLMLRMAEILKNDNQRFAKAPQYQFLHGVDVKIDTLKKEEAGSFGHFFQNQKLKTELKNETVDKKKLRCDYCKKMGHLKKGCYELIGYPDWFKSNPKFQEKGKKKGSAAAAETAGDTLEDDGDDEDLHFAAAVAAVKHRPDLPAPAAARKSPPPGAVATTAETMPRRRSKSPSRGSSSSRRRCDSPHRAATANRLPTSPAAHVGKRATTTRPWSSNSAAAAGRLKKAPDATSSADRAKETITDGSGPPSGSG